MEISTVYTCQDTESECETETGQRVADETHQCDHAEESEQWLSKDFHRLRCEVRARREHAKTVGVRFDSSCEDDTESAEHRRCCIGYAHCDSDFHRQEIGQVENNARYLRQMGDFQTMTDELTDAKEQLYMASLAEREMREMLMRIGGDDPDERSKHGVPRQQDLTQQQPPTESPPQKQHVPPQSSSQPPKQQSRKDPRQQ